MKGAASLLGRAEAPLLVAANRLAQGVCRLVAAPRLSILVYHRVHRQRDELYPREPDAQRFERMMRFVARTYHVMTLGDAARRLVRGDLPPRALVITFDDGYADNAEVALPILLRHGLVATFFISSGFLDGGRMWNDSVVETIRACRQRELDLSPLGLDRCVLAETADRRSVVARVLQRLKYLRLGEREQAVACLQTVCQVPVLPSRLMLRSEQVRHLHRAGMEIGAHTVNHPILTTLSAEEAEFEITAGRRRLEEIIESPVGVFAYPNGRPDKDYDATHVALLRRLGFDCAVTTAPGVSQRGSDLFQLPRFGPAAEGLTVWALRLLKNQWNPRHQIAGGHAAR